MFVIILNQINKVRNIVMNLLLKNGKLVTTEDIKKCDILIEGEKIKTIKQKQNFNEIPKGCQIIDIKGLCQPFGGSFLW